MKIIKKSNYLRSSKYWINSKNSPANNFCVPTSVWESLANTKNCVKHKGVMMKNTFFYWFSSIFHCFQHISTLTGMVLPLKIHNYYFLSTGQLPIKWHWLPNLPGLLWAWLLRYTLQRIRMVSLCYFSFTLYHTGLFCAIQFNNSEQILSIS